VKQVFSILLAFALLTTLTACNQTQATTIPEIRYTEPTTIPTTFPSSEPTTEPTVPPTKPLHSAFYIEGVSVEDVILYFKEVCLQTEYVEEGDPTKLQKWTSPIYYILHGEYTQEDYYVLTDFMAWLNTIEGFPGIWETTQYAEASLNIHFCDNKAMISLLGDNFVNADGGVTFWYTDDEIHDAVICYRNDIDQELRNSVILEEIYNGLGAAQDTWLREDSIIYDGYTTPQELTAMDELLLKLLYHPMLRCGMGAEECEAIIRYLYY